MSQQGREWVLKNLDGKDVAVRVVLQEGPYLSRLNLLSNFL